MTVVSGKGVSRLGEEEGDGSRVRSIKSVGVIGGRTDAVEAEAWVGSKEGNDVLAGDEAVVGSEGESDI
jgi:hypothetical protein